MGVCRGNYQIDRAAPADLGVMVLLLGELFGVERGFQIDAAVQRRGLELLLADAHRAAVLVARPRGGGPVAGMVTGQLVTSTAEGALSLWVEDLVVCRQARTRGVGRALLSAILDWAQGHGATRAQLLADADNAPALAFYDHLAWQPTGMVARRLRLKA
jgi:GNAT superfamily N-acetyltransferase